MTCQEAEDTTVPVQPPCKFHPVRINTRSTMLYILPLLAWSTHSSDPCLLYHYSLASSTMYITCPLPITDNKVQEIVKVIQVVTTALKQQAALQGNIALHAALVFRAAEAIAAAQLAKDRHDDLAYLLQLTGQLAKAEHQVSSLHGVEAERGA